MNTVKVPKGRQLCSTDLNFEPGAATLLNRIEAPRASSTGCSNSRGEGYERPRCARCSNRTGLYRQAFYDNFADKEDCYLQALRRRRRAAGRAGNAAAARRARPGGQAARPALRALLRLPRRGAGLGRALIVEVHAGRAGGASRSEPRRWSGLPSFIDRARGGGRRRAPPAIAAEAVVAGIHRGPPLPLASRRDDGFRQLLPELMYFAVLPYFGARGGSRRAAARVAS